MDDDTKKGAPITARMLLSLATGTKLRVVLGKRERTITLRERPTLSSAGKPGLRRVRLSFIDMERMPKEMNDELWSEMVALDRRAYREVGGDKVVAIVPCG